MMRSNRRVSFIIAALVLTFVSAPLFALTVTLTFTGGPPPVVIGDNTARDLNPAVNIIEFDNAAGGGAGFPSTYSVVRGTVDLDGSDANTSVLRVTNLTIQRLAGDGGGFVAISPIHVFANPPAPAFEWDHIDFSWQRPGPALPGPGNSVAFQGFVNAAGVGPNYASGPSVGGIDPEAFADTDGPFAAPGGPPWTLSMDLGISIAAAAANIGDQCIIPTSAEVVVSGTSPVPALGPIGTLALVVAMMGLAVLVMIHRRQGVATGG